jgi:hypothetical protein
MNAMDLGGLLHVRASARSRPGFVAALASALLGVGTFALRYDESPSKAKRKNQKRRKRKKQPTQPPLPPSSGPVLCTAAACLGSFTIGLGGTGTGRVAQTFVAVASGPLVRADIPIRKNPGSVGDYFLQLGVVNAFGVPTNEVLASPPWPGSACPMDLQRSASPLPIPPRSLPGCGTRWS